MREKNQVHKRNLKALALFVVFALVVYAAMNRVQIKDHLMTYFM